MSGMKHGLLAIGEVMAEIRTDGEAGFALGFAGDSYNTAVYAAREIPAPGAVAYLTRVGSEPLSCLLYTSPSPRDGLLSRMPSSA